MTEVNYVSCKINVQHFLYKNKMYFYFFLYIYIKEKLLMTPTPKSKQLFGSQPTSQETLMGRTSWQSASKRDGEEKKTVALQQCYKNPLQGGSSQQARNHSQ